MIVAYLMVMPIASVSLAVMVLYYGVSIWNSWFWASAIIRTREMYPLQVILREILMQNDVSSMTTGSSAKMCIRDSPSPGRP